MKNQSNLKVSLVIGNWLKVLTMITKFFVNVQPPGLRSVDNSVIWGYVLTSLIKYFADVEVHYIYFCV